MKQSRWCWTAGIGLEAFRHAGIPDSDIPVAVYEGDDPAAYVASVHTAVRHLTKTERADAVVAANEAAGALHGPGRGAGKTTADMAREANVSEATVKKVRRQRKAPERKAPERKAPKRVEGASLLFGTKANCRTAIRFADELQSANHGTSPWPPRDKNMHDLVLDDPEWPTLVKDVMDLHERVTKQTQAVKFPELMQTQPQPDPERQRLEAEVERANEALARYVEQRVAAVCETFTPERNGIGERLGKMYERAGRRPNGKAQ